MSGHEQLPESTHMEDLLDEQIAKAAAKEVCQWVIERYGLKTTELTGELPVEAIEESRARALLMGLNLEAVSLHNPEEALMMADAVFADRIGEEIPRHILDLGRNQDIDLEDGVVPVRLDRLEGLLIEDYKNGEQGLL